MLYQYQIVFNWLLSFMQVLKIIMSDVYTCMSHTHCFYVFLTLKGPGGGGIRPPSTFRAIISWKFFSAPRAFMTFFVQVLRNFWRYFRKNRPYGSKVTQHYVIERRLKI